MRFEVNLRTVRGENFTSKFESAPRTLFSRMVLDGYADPRAPAFRPWLGLALGHELNSLQVLGLFDLVERYARHVGPHSGTEAGIEARAFPGTSDDFHRVGFR